MSLPILYSLRRCPYAMRARMGLLLAEQPVLIRDIVTRNKPSELLVASPKGTVPVLVMDDGTVIDQSLDIMLWALNNQDPLHLLKNANLDLQQHSEIMTLIGHNDAVFIPQLEQYRAAVRYHDPIQQQHKKLCQTFIDDLEFRLSNHQYLISDEPSLADFALFPFISQFSRVNRKWFVTANYSNIERWLTNHYHSRLYTKVMVQYPQWIESRKEFLLNF